MIVLWCLLVAAGLAAESAAENGDARFFDRRVAPILTKRCLGCHNNEQKAANISFLDRDSLTAAVGPVAGPVVGPVVGPGDPASSLLVRAIRRTGDIKMPPGPALPPNELATLTEWVRRGAPFSRRWSLRR